MRVRSWAGLAMALVAAAGCDDHAKPVAHGAPEYLHQALSGDVLAQARLADCLGSAAGCLAAPADPAMACAWRGVRLGSQSPDLSLADTFVYRAACAAKDESFRQRSAIAQDDFMRRVYDRPAPGASAEPPTAGLLYPSIETVRQRINIQLGSNAPARLPAFGPPQVSPDQGRLAWKACSSALCLEGVAPRFGGGLYNYRVVSKGPQGDGRQLAAKLATAGLEAEAVAEPIAALTRNTTAGVLNAGPICWAAGRGDGENFAGASLGPC